MMGNYQVRFLGEKEAVMLFSYPTIQSNTKFVKVWPIGLIRLFTAMSSKDSILLTGAVMAESWKLWWANDLSAWGQKACPPYRAKCCNVRTDPYCFILLQKKETLRGQVLLFALCKKQDLTP